MYTFTYPASLTDNGEGGFIVSFRDVPEINTEIWDRSELQQTGANALITAADICFEKKIPFPDPSEVRQGEVAIQLPFSAGSKILLHKTMLAANVRPSDLARRMGKIPQEVNRILDLRHNTKIDTIQEAFKALGKNLSVVLTD